MLTTSIQDILHLYRHNLTNTHTHKYLYVRGAFELVLAQIGQRASGAYAAMTIEVKALHTLTSSIHACTYITHITYRHGKYLHVNIKTQQMHSRVNGMSQLRVGILQQKGLHDLEL